MLAYQESRGGKRRIDGDAREGSSGNAENDGDDEGSAHEWGGQQFSQIRPADRAERTPQPLEYGVFESVRTATMSHGQGQEHK
jgi:hypothetical protein